ncbi:MAG: CRISPR-associated protein Cas5 [Candidatus Helarchaeota archaeon]
MSDDSVLVFDVKGDFGFFRIPETTRAPVSYPFTRTSIVGIIGAIIGLKRNSYWSNNNPLANSNIAIELMNDIIHSTLMINYTHTRNTISVQNIQTSITSWSSDFRGFVTAVRLDTLRNIHYRIYFQAKNDLYNRVKKAIKNSEFVYPPYLGHANLFADIEYIGEYPLLNNDDREKIDTVIASSQLDSNFYQTLKTKLTFIPNIPIRMLKKVESDQLLSNMTTETFLMGAIKDKPWHVLINKDTKIFKVDIDGKIYRICFMPSDNSIQAKNKATKKQSIIKAVNNTNNSNSNYTEIKSRQLLFLFDARDCVPNGEREDGTIGSRLDSITNKALVTDVCIKRLIRDYINLRYSSSPTRKILVHNTLLYKNNAVVNLKNIFLDDLGKSNTQLRNMDYNQLKDAICNAFIDHRLFGSKFKLKNKLYATTGPVQFEIAQSLNIPTSHNLVITSSLSSESGKSQGAMGQFSFLNYAIFLTHGIIKNSLAKETKLTEDDIQILFDSIWNGTKSHVTRTKFQQMPRLLLSLEYSNPSFQINGLKRTIKLSNEQVESFKQCIFDFSPFLDYIRKYEDQIERIQYAEDIHFTYGVGETQYNSFKQLIEKEKVQIKLVKIDL